MLIRGKCHCGNIAYAVVNVNAFEGVDPSLLRRSSANFDGEGTDSRLERRQRNWIADVDMQASAAPPSGL